MSLFADGEAELKTSLASEQNRIATAHVLLRESLQRLLFPALIRITEDYLGVVPFSVWPAQEPKAEWVVQVDCNGLVWKMDISKFTMTAHELDGRVGLAWGDEWRAHFNKLTAFCLSNDGLLVVVAGGSAKPNAQGHRNSRVLVNA